MYGMAKRGLTAPIVIMTAAFLAVAGCGGTPAAGGGSSAPQPATSAQSSPAAAGTQVDVTMKEFSFAIAKQDLTAGTYTFMLNNAGTMPHAMAIKGPGIDPEKQSDTIGGGQQGTLTVTLQPGSYDVWCPVGNHRAQGMETTLTVK
jgi:plastocyanin